MIGRAAQGRPWLCGQIAHYLAGGGLLPEPTGAEKFALMAEHLRGLYEFYGEYRGLRIARKHVGWYLQQAPGGATFRGRFNGLESAAEQLAELDAFLNNNDYEELAA
jgi:tRNA-dihydrouridine synthase B